MVTGLGKEAGRSLVASSTWSKVWAALRTDAIGRKRLYWYDDKDEELCLGVIKLEDVESVAVASGASHSLGDGDFQITQRAATVHHTTFRAPDAEHQRQWVQVRTPKANGKRIARDC